jgi:ATP-dependent Lhr-like helicase
MADASFAAATPAGRRVAGDCKRAPRADRRPTGRQATLAAFLSAIDALVHEGVEGRLQDATRVVYVSLLKALSNDIQRNLEQPLAGIGAQLTRLGMPAFEIRAQVRTGDTSQTERAAMRRLAPHILVTTPESLYLLLTSESGRRMLSSARTLIVDEIHAVAGTKRGAHLALSLERLDALARQPIQRIGLSATQKPIEEIARFLTGSRPGTACEIVDSGHVRERDLALVMPGAPLEAVMSGEVWGTVYDQLAALISQHHTTLIFANTRRMVERVTRHLAERIGEENVAAHHGSLAKEQRFDAEQRLKAGKLKAMVATASLRAEGSTSATSSSSASGSPASISGCFSARSVAPTTRSAACRRVACFPSSRDEAGRIGGAPRRGASWRARSTEHSCPSARRAVAADRGRGVSARVRGGRALRARHARMAVPAPRAQGLR